MLFQRRERASPDRTAFDSPVASEEGAPLDPARVDPSGQGGSGRQPKGEPDSGSVCGQLLPLSMVQKGFVWRPGGLSGEAAGVLSETRRLSVPWSPMVWLFQIVLML